MKKILIPPHIVLSKYDRSHEGIEAWLYLNDMTLEITGQYDGEKNFIGMPRVDVHVNRPEKFCCEMMKAKWQKEIGFCSNQRGEYSYAAEPYLFWTLQYKDQTFPALFLDSYGHKNEKVDKCPFCSATIKFKKVDKHAEKRICGNV